jgi:hypothetical protein
MYPQFKSVLMLAAAVMPIGTTLIAQSAFAATLAYAAAEVRLHNFSRLPANPQATAAQQLGTTGTGAFVTTRQEALFCTDSTCGQPGTAENFSISQANGSGSSYYGFGQSAASVAGYDFAIGANETFSFNFEALLQVGTNATQPGETATASSNISFQIFAGSDSNNLVLLDQLILSGLARNAQTTAQLGISPSSSNFSWLSGAVNSQVGAAPASILLSGLFSRHFDQATRISFVETKQTAAAVAVPEPNLLPALGVLLLVLGYRRRIQPLNLAADLKS